MTKLTDLEVCKRIAEIEGVKEILIDNKGGVTAVFDNLTCFDYNPLVNKALCWDLMIKYGIDLSENNDFYYASYFLWRGREGKSESPEVSDECPRRAVCLAIIEMHNDN